MGEKEWEDYFYGRKDWRALGNPENLKEGALVRKQRNILKAPKRKAINGIKFLSEVHEGIGNMTDDPDYQLNQIFTLERLAALTMVVKRETTRLMQRNQILVKEVSAGQLSHMVFVATKGDVRPDNHRLLRDLYYCAEMDQLLGERLEERGIAREEFIKLLGLENAWRRRPSLDEPGVTVYIEDGLCINGEEVVVGPDGVKKAKLIKKIHTEKRDKV